MTSRETPTAKCQLERPSFRVPRSKAESAIQRLVKIGVLDRHFSVKTEDQTVILPLLRTLTEAEITDLRKLAPNAKSGTEDFEPRTKRPRTLEEALADRVPIDLLPKLPRSFDIVGDITVLELESELTPYETSIAEAIMKIHPNVRAVFAKSGEVSGAERIRPIRHIAGENRTQTIHKEHGCLFRVDLSRAFFSPRLSAEHQRVSEMVGRGERVVDMFAGVGPFSIMIAKNQGGALVEAIDANPEAIELVRENIRANKVEANVHVHLGDARDVVREKLKRSASRVIMNHPSASRDFIRAACDALQSSGGTVHYYTFAGQNWQDESRGEAEGGVEASGNSVERVIATHRVREVAPMKWQVVVDLRVVPGQ